MVFGELFKAGAALGASAIASEKVAKSMTDAIEKSVDRINRLASAVDDDSFADDLFEDDEDKLKSKAPRKPKGNVTAKCMGCHAPMSGTPGVSYRCPYCDTIQTLN